MFLATSEFTITPRVNVEPYNVQMNDTTVNILKLIFEFKIATAWQITRFLKQRDRVKYLYLKLHRMWQAEFLESFKVFTGSRAGMPVYYMLSKLGLKTLAELGQYDTAYLKNYPTPKSLFASHLFKHEAQVVELASQEILNRSQTLQIAVLGEASSQTHEYRSDKNIEVLTPDYTIVYTVNGQVERIYSEFERTNKMNHAMLKKIERYTRFLNQGDRKHTTLRLIFQTPGMETAFWLNILLNKPALLQYVRVLTTHISMLTSTAQFLEPIYASEDTVKLERQGRVIATIPTRIKLFSFL